MFEGPLGALHAIPELSAMPETINSLALGQLDQHYTLDLAVASGNKLLIVHGRDRKLTLSRKDQATVPSARVSEREFPSAPGSVVIGDFKGDGFSDVALITDGSLQLLAQPRLSRQEWKETSVRWNGGGELEIAGKPAKQCLLERKQTSLTGLSRRFQVHAGQKAPTGWQPVVERRLRQPEWCLTMQVVRSHIFSSTDNPVRAPNSTRGSPAPRFKLAASLETNAAPAAVLPLRLDIDALTDLVVLRSGSVAPVVTLTSGGGELAPDHVIFSNTTPFSLPRGGPVTPYPSNIVVSGEPAVSQVRVRVNGLSESFPPNLDMLLVESTGTKGALPLGRRWPTNDGQRHDNFRRCCRFSGRAVRIQKRNLSTNQR